MSSPLQNENPELQSLSHGNDNHDNDADDYNISMYMYMYIYPSVHISEILYIYTYI